MEHKVASNRHQSCLAANMFSLGFRLIRMTLPPIINRDDQLVPDPVRLFPLTRQFLNPLLRVIEMGRNESDIRGIYEYGITLDDPDRRKRDSLDGMTNRSGVSGLVGA